MNTTRKPWLQMLLAGALIAALVFAIGGSVRTTPSSGPDGYPIGTQAAQVTDQDQDTLLSPTGDWPSRKLTEIAKQGTEVAIAQEKGAFGTQDPFWGTPFSPDNPLPTSPAGFGEVQFIQRRAGSGRIIEGWNDQALQYAFISTNAWVTHDDNGYLMIVGGYRRSQGDDKPSQSAIVVSRLADSKQLIRSEAEIIPLPHNSGPSYIIGASVERVLLRTVDGHFYWYIIEKQAFDEVTGQQLTAQKTFDGEIIDSSTRLSTITNEFTWNEWIPAKSDNLRIVAGARSVLVDSSIWGGFNLSSSQSGIAVYDNQSKSPSTPTWYFPDGKFGLIRIIGTTDADQLILMDTTGSVLYFDVSKRAFVHETEVLVERWPWYDGPSTSLP